jgi:hypothetical protein
MQDSNSPAISEVDEDAEILYAMKDLPKIHVAY